MILHARRIAINYQNENLAKTTSISKYTPFVKDEIVFLFLLLNIWKGYKDYLIDMKFLLKVQLIWVSICKQGQTGMEISIFPQT